MDSVFVHNLSIRGTHGVMAHERHIEQEFLLDMVAEVDARAAAASDKLKDAVDYVDFVNIAKDVIASNSFYLIEKIADEIATRILADTRITKVAVTVRKPAVLESGVAGITIERARV